MRILHIEDSPLDTALVEATLQSAGLACQIVHVDTREALVTALHEGGFDVVLSDFTMPGFDGLSALRLVRARDPLVPFIFVSGTIGEDLATETLRAGATDYVLKTRLTRLEACVRRALAEAEERRQHQAAQRRLAEQTEVLTLVAKATRDAIWDWDLPAQRLTWLGDIPEWLLGYDAADLDDGLTGWTERVHPDDRGPITASLERVLADTGESWHGEYRFQRRDGTYASILHRAYIIRDPGGRPTRVVGAMTDITERVELEAQLRHSQKMEAVGTLAGSVAHDFNNVLMSILAFAELARDAMPTAHSARGDIDEVLRAVERAAALSRQLLAFSRKQVVDPVVLDLGDVVTDLERMLNRLIGQRVTIEVALDPGHRHVLADRSQMEQVIMNLALNARDAMPNGGRLTMAIRSEPAQASADGGSHVVLVVSDTGVGMNEATRSRIFEPFFTTKSAGLGTGLGLSTVFGIVERHHGRIDVASEVGRGTTFAIRFPAVPSTAAGSSAQGETARLTGHGVLVVEDDAGLRRLVARVLRAEGYLVLEAGSAEHARGLLEREHEPIDLLIADALLPGESGLELVRAARRRDPSCRALLMSGHAGIAAEANAVLDGGFLQKPFSTQLLVKKVRQALESRPA